MKTQNFLLTILLIGSLKLFATAQAPDYLIIGKDTLRIHSNPLEEYFKTKPIPNGLITSSSSANWRGYIAYFTFFDEKLVVENIYKQNYKIDENGKGNYKQISIYNEIFGEVPHFDCSFYNGLLICPNGKVVEYVHMGYSSVFENYKLFEIKSGKINSSKEFSAEEFYEFKINYFKYYKTTEEYKQKAIDFKKMFQETQSNVDKSFEDMGLNEKRKKENKALKLKEQEYEMNKQIDNFMFMFVGDFMKTIEIPKTN